MKEEETKWKGRKIWGRGERKNKEEKGSKKQEYKENKRKNKEGGGWDKVEGKENLEKIKKDDKKNRRKRWTQSLKSIHYFSFFLIHFFNNKTLFSKTILLNSPIPPIKPYICKYFLKY